MNTVPSIYRKYLSQAHMANIYILTVYLTMSMCIHLFSEGISIKYLPVCPIKYITPAE